MKTKTRKTKVRRTTKEKLLALAEYLEKKVKSAGFDMEVWSCGTAACAAGHAVMAGIFTECRLGRPFRAGGSLYRRLMPAGGFLQRRRRRAPGRFRLDCWRALQKELPELSEDQIADLFCSPAGSPAPGRLAKARELRRVARRLP